MSDKEKQMIINRIISNERFLDYGYLDKETSEDIMGNYNIDYLELQKLQQKLVDILESL